MIDLEESLSASFIPFNLLYVDRVRIITVLDLVRMERDGRIYIARQYGEYSFELELEVLLFGKG